MNIIFRHVGAHLMSLVQNSHHLEMLSLGCLEELVSSYAKSLLESTANKHHNSMKVLALASIKDYPDDYVITDLNINLLKPLQQLQVSLTRCTLIHGVKG